MDYSDFSTKKVSAMGILIGVLLALVVVTSYFFLVTDVGAFGARGYVGDGERAGSFLMYKFELAPSSIFGNLWGMLSSGSTPAAGGQGGNLLVPVLLYTNITSGSATSSTGISVTNFQDQLAALHEAGYQAITLRAFQNFTSGGAGVAPNSVVLVFGNDSASQYNLVDPILEAYDDHAVMIVADGTSGGGAAQNDAWDIVTRTQFDSEMAGVEIGKGFTENVAPEALPQNEIVVQPSWSASDLINVLSAGASKQLPFSENIDASSTDWFAGWGNVELGEGGATINGAASSTGGGVFLDGSQPWTDYAEDATINWGSADAITLYARYNDAKNYQSCGFSSSGAKITEVVNGTSTQMFTSNAPIATSTTDLGMRVIQDKVECLANGQVVAYAYGTSPSLASGGIGLSAWSKAGQASEVTVHSVAVSSYNSAQDYAATYKLPASPAVTATKVAPQVTAEAVNAASVVKGQPAPPPSVMLENLGSPSVLSAWTAGANSVVSADTALHTQGTESLALTTDGAGDSASAAVFNQGPFNLTNHYLEVWIRVSSTTNIDNLSFSAGSDNLQNNFYTWHLDSQLSSAPDESEIQAGEWVPIVLTFDVDGSNTTMTGSPDMQALNSFEISASDQGSAPVTVLLGGVAAVPEPSQGALTIVLDNGWISEYTLAMPTLAQYGFPAVVAEIPETANDPDFMSTAQVQYLQNNLGWDIACHTWDHDYSLGLPGTTIATMDSEFSQCQNWLVDNGVGKAANILVWPNGSNSPSAIAEASKYFVAARGIIGTSFNTLPAANPMALYATEFGGDTPVATLDADADRCMANHEWCIFYGHIISTSTPQNNDQYNSASFNAFVAHIASDGIPVKTITQVLANEPTFTPSQIALAPAVVATSTPGSASSYSYADFANSPSWQRDWGSMSIDPSGSMNLSANASTTGASVLLDNSNNWTNYTFNTTFNWVKGETVGIIARYTNENNYVVCEYDASNPGEVLISLEQYVGGNRVKLATGVDLDDTGPGENGLQASVQVNGREGTCSLNGHVVSNAGTGYTLSSPLSGGIGFTTWDPNFNNSEIDVQSVNVEDN